jgi:carboxypeptidase Q
MLRRLAFLLVIAWAAPVCVFAAEPVDLAMVGRIRHEAFANSKVMDTLAELTDVIGPRVTGSPQMKQANEWTRQQLESWGLQDAHLESWGPFGEGWTLEHVSVHLVAPTEAPLMALPKAWTPGTDGVVRGALVQVTLDSEEDLEKHAGTLAGKILLLEEASELKSNQEPLLERYNEQELEELAKYEVPTGPQDQWRKGLAKRIAFGKVLRSFLEEEQVVATLEPSSRDGGTVRVGRGGSREPGEPKGVAGLVMAVEHYNRLLRLVARKLDVVLELDVRTRFHGDDLMAYNTLAEIPGAEKRAGVVMLGAHLDSWHAGTGATDNAAGVAVVMESARILQSLGVRPKRTIRVALWSGEEQGLEGSRAYVRQHFAARPEPEDPEQRKLPSFLRKDTGPLQVQPEHALLSAYFNLDNGTGKIRGVYVQENAAVVPIFEAWLEPLKDLGAGTITMRRTGGTDHLAFDAVGLSGFQFIQDDVEYSSLTHHTNLDVYDRVQREDLMQAAAVLTSFAYHAATRDGLLPRKPMPDPDRKP